MPNNSGYRTANASVYPVRKKSAGPGSVTPAHIKKQRAEEAKQKGIRDEHRIHNFVVSVLDEHRNQVANGNPAAATNVIKISMKQIQRIMMQLKNTRFSRIPELINRTLGESIDLNQTYGSWVMVEHDYPDWLFVKLPADETQVLRFKVQKESAGSESYTLEASTEVLMDSFDPLEEEEEEIDEDSHDPEDDAEYEEEEDEEISPAKK